MTSLSLIEAARSRFPAEVRRTPLLSSPFIDEIAGRQVLVKAECLQHTGSFKFRGAWSAISALPEMQRASGVLAFSSGNHAQGVAAAAAMHGVPAVIIMPADAPALKIANTRSYGAEVVLYDRGGNRSREEIGLEIATARNLTLVHPFDDPQVIAGQGTVGLEIAEQVAELGLTTADVIVNCSGGGLTSGIALALEAKAPGLRVRTAEPEGFDDAARSVASGNRERNLKLTGSICDAILSPELGQNTFPVIKRLCGPGLVVSDDEALSAMAEAFTRLKLVLEPGGAASLAAALYRADEIEGETVIVVASGGNTDAAMFNRALAKAV